jgi:hypothetical protein
MENQTPKTDWFKNPTLLDNLGIGYTLRFPEEGMNNNNQKNQEQLNEAYQNALKQQNKEQFGTKFKFKEDYEAKGFNFIPNGSQQASFVLNYKFKKGDVFSGRKTPTNGGINPSAVAYSVEIVTPEALKKDNTKWNGQAVFEVPYTVIEEQTLTNTDINTQSFLQKHKNHLLILGGLVLGFFAYKKFKK